MTVLKVAVGILAIATSIAASIVLFAIAGAVVVALARAIRRRPR